MIMSRPIPSASAAITGRRRPSSSRSGAGPSPLIRPKGAQWENVIVYDDGLGRTAEDRARWLYTAITRAERGLVLLD